MSHRNHCAVIPAGKVTDASRSLVFILFAMPSTAAVAAEQIPLNTFLTDVRDQLYKITQTDNQKPGRTLISNIRVEMNVVADKDPQGRIQYFVLDGLVDRKDIITQKISFDIQLQPDASAAAGRPGSRVYSTRERDNRYGRGSYQPAGQYPPYPGHYMPDIYPLILMNKGTE